MISPWLIAGGVAGPVALGLAFRLGRGTCRRRVMKDRLQALDPHPGSSRPSNQGTIHATRGYARSLPWIWIAVGLALLSGLVGVLTGPRLSGGWPHLASQTIWQGLLAASGLVIGGSLLARLLVSRQAAAGRQALARSVAPLTLRIACLVAAGMGLESAIGTVVRDGPHGHARLKRELLRYLQESRLGFTRWEALDGMDRRCDLPAWWRVSETIRAAEGHPPELGASLANCAISLEAEAMARQRQQGTRALWLAIGVWAVCLAPLLAIAYAP